MKVKMMVLGLVLGSMLVGANTVNAAPPVPGAIFTTNSACSTVNSNMYSSQDEVYLNGGPSRPGAAGLKDGSYYIQVTSPSGEVLGKSLAPAVTVVGGEFVQCYQLSSIVNSAWSGFTELGYNFTSNRGGEYKVWVSNVSTFDNNSSKTDSFKIKQAAGPEIGPM